MDTLVIEITNQKAIKLLEDLEALDLIRVITKSSKLSVLRKKIKVPMSAEAIENQLNDLRGEWQRNI